MMYDITGAFDSIEAKLETIGKYCKTLLVERGSLDQEHFVYELMLKRCWENEDFIKKAVKYFFCLRK